MNEFAEPPLDSQEAPVDYPPLNLSSYKEKVFSQAERLRMLEGYKDLCERRLIELFPQHVLPVQEEHLGQSLPPPSSEAHHLKQKVSRLEQQLASQQFTASTQEFSLKTSGAEGYTALYAASAELKREKAELEETLRAEVLMSEEQRSYIEVLKQAIESRIMEFGASGSIEAYADFAQAKTQADQVRRNGARMQSTLVEQDAQLKRLKEQLQLKVQECSYLLSDKETNDRKLAQAADALKYAEEELISLEEEKKSLIEYIEQQDTTGVVLSRELNENKTRLEKALLEYEGLRTQHNQHKTDFIQLEVSASLTKGDLEKSERNLKETQKSFVSTKARIEDKNREINELNEKLRISSAKSEELQGHCGAVKESLSATSEELSDLRAAHARLIQEKIEVLGHLESLERQYEILQTEKDNTHKELNRLLTSLAAANTENSELLGTLSTANSRTKQLEEELKNTLDSYHQALYREKQLNNTVDCLNAEVVQLGQRLDEADTERAQQTQLIEGLNSEAAALNSDRNAQAEALGAERDSNKYLQEQNAAFKDRVDELNRSLAFTNASFAESENQFHRVQFDFDSLTSQFQALTRDNSQLSSDRAAALSELENLNFHINSLNRELTERNSEGSQVVKLISSFSRNFTEKQSISKQFRETIEHSTLLENIKITHWTETANNEIQQLTRKVTELTGSLESRAAALNHHQHESTLLTQENSALRDREKALSSQLETLARDSRASREDFTRKVDTLHSEIAGHRREIQGLQESNYESEVQLSSSAREIQELANNVEDQVTSYRLLDEKFQQLQREKTHCENLVAQLQSSVNSSLQNLYSELVRSQSGASGLEKEKLRVAQLLSRAGDLEEQRGLNLQLGRLDRQLHAQQQHAQSLECEAKRLQQFSVTRFPGV